MELPARDNLRALPQQSVNVFSNLVDIEGFFDAAENLGNCTYLRRIDIPATDREQAMHELATMGVTAASLFPGVEGVCRTLAERLFPPIVTESKRKPEAARTPGPSPAEL
jgi:hypothetical protein